MDNETRIKYGIAATRAGTPDYTSSEPREYCVDTIANVLHLAHREGLDVGGVIDSARMHFDAEQGGED